MLRYFANGRIRWKNGMRCNTRTNWEFYAVIDGKCGAVFRDGEKPVMREHTLWVFAPECAHAWADDGRHTYHRMSFHFGSVPYPLDEVVRRKGWLETPIASEDIAQLLAMAAELEPHFCRPNSLSTLYFQRHLMDLSLLALRGEQFGGQSPALTDLAHFKVEHALSWYAEHLARHPSVKEVADAIHISPSHLRRLFWQSRHSSPKEIFQGIRLEKAQELMGRSALTLEEVARLCGYANASHLCREYKARNHFTPNKWRRRLIDRFSQPLPAGTVHTREFSARPQERTMPA